MSWQFNPPPGWPQQPPGWVPPPGWAPDPSWPPAPAGWQFWLPATTAPAAQPTAQAASAQPAAAQAASASGSAVPATAAGPASQPGFGSASQPGYGSASQPAAFGAAPVPAQPAVPFPDPAAPTAGPLPAPASRPSPAPGGPPRPWFRRWWAYALLLLLLLVGVGTGFGATWLIVTIAASGQEVTAAPPPAAPASTGPAVPSPQLPRVTPPGSPVGGLPSGQLCGEVAVIMITMTTAIIDDFDDLDEYQDALIDSRRAAAGELRQLTTGDAAQQDALDTLADELDAAAQMVEDNRGEFAVDESFNAVSAAYADFHTATC